MKQLKPTNLIAVEVPEGSDDFTWSTEQDLHSYSDGNEIDVYVGKTTGEILGEVTKEGVQFDVEPYLGYYTVSNTKYYYNYMPFNGIDFRDIIDNSFKTPQESFQSLLQANNVEIPEGKKLLILLKQ